MEEGIINRGKIRLGIIPISDNLSQEEEEKPIRLIDCENSLLSKTWPDAYHTSVTLPRFDHTHDLTTFLLTAAQEKIARKLWAILVNRSEILFGKLELEKKRKLADVQGHERLQKVKIGNIEFAPVEPSSLGSVPVLVQALDNQWIPRSLWSEMIEKGQFSADIENQLEKLVRTEYLRALVNAKQVVVNRAYIYNNPVVFKDYVQGSQNREVFKTFLDSGVIVPFLYTERTPVEPPSFETVPKGFLAWQQISQEVCMQCVRLSWDDQLNQKLSREQLTQKYHNLAQYLTRGDFNKYIRDLGLDLSQKDDLRARFEEIEQVCFDFSKQGRSVTRSDLYKKFIIAGDNPAERQYDLKKPFSGEIKQLLDLAYNSHLADALGGYLLTPADSLPRTALQEWEQARSHHSIVTSEELVRLLRQAGFELSQGGMYLKSVGLLSLKDVQEVRCTDEWAVYIGGLERLLRTPSWFVDGSATKVYQNYTRLMKKMTDLALQRGTLKETALTASWTPVTELVVEVAGAKLSVTWTIQGPVYRFTGDILSHVVEPDSAPFEARFNIYGWDGMHTQADLVNSLDFMKGTMQEPQKQWVEVQRLVRELPGFQERQID